MNDFGINIDTIMRQVELENKIEYRHPLTEPYSDSSRITRSQQVLWDYHTKYINDPAYLAIIGAKGSGKSHLGAAFAFDMGQRFPESTGCIIANSYTQAKDSAGKHLSNMAARLGYNIEFFTSKKIKGEPVSSLYVIDLDGKGFDDGKNFYVIVRSFDAVKKLEGIEIDWMWVEEVQDAQKDRLETALSRVRGKSSPNKRFLAGMSGDEQHYMYKFLPSLGALEEERRAEGERVIIPESTNPVTGVVNPERELYGILVEPTLFENEMNLPDGYIDSLYAIYDADMAERYIHGRRTAQTSNRIAYNYRDWLHRTGRMSNLLCTYDPHSELIFSIDFNTAPMSATVWQEKPWNDLWMGSNISIDEIAGAVRVIKSDGSVDTYDSLESYAAPNRTVLAQVDEYEVWEGGTEGLANEIAAKYANPRAKHGSIGDIHYHTNGITLLGDATGNREYTTASTTDWKILTTKFADIPNVTIIRGLQQESDYKTGRIKYSNPPRRDTFNVLNLVLRNAEGAASICFLPESELASGGAAASVSSMKTREDGTMDLRMEKRADRETIQSHFFDTVRYVAWYYSGGASALSLDEFEQSASRISREASVGVGLFTSGSSGGGWGSLF